MVFLGSMPYVPSYARSLKTPLLSYLRSWTDCLYNKSKGVFYSQRVRHKKLQEKQGRRGKKEKEKEKEEKRKKGKNQKEKDGKGGKRKNKKTEKKKGEEQQRKRTKRKKKTENGRSATRKKHKLSSNIHQARGFTVQKNAGG